MVPVVPLATVVVPIVTAADAVVTVQSAGPSVQIVPLMSIVELARSALVTRPVAVKALVTVKLAIDGAVASTTLPLPVTPQFCIVPVRLAKQTGLFVMVGRLMV